MHKFLRDPSKVKHERKFSFCLRATLRELGSTWSDKLGAGLGDVKQEAGGLRPSDPVMN